MTQMATWLHRGLLLCWLAAVGGLLALSVVTHLATSVVIRGGSMAPALPAGSLAVVERVDPRQARPGDILTARADNGVVVTHRVTRVVELAGETYVELKGDANPAPDPVLVPARAIVGRVGLSLPLAGYLAVMLSGPSGVISLLAMLAAVLLLITWLEGYQPAIPGGVAPAIPGTAGDQPPRKRGRAAVA